MDMDRIEGAATNMAGKVKENVGGLLGDAKTRAEGVADQVSGQVQNAYGSAKDAVREGTDTLGAQIDEDDEGAALYGAAGRRRRGLPHRPADRALDGARAMALQPGYPPAPSRLSSPATAARSSATGCPGAPSWPASPRRW